MTKTLTGNVCKMFIVTGDLTIDWHELSTHPPEIGNPAGIIVYDQLTNPCFQNITFNYGTLLCFKLRRHIRNASLAASASFNKALKLFCFVQSYVNRDHLSLSRFKSDYEH